MQDICSLVFDFFLMYLNLLIHFVLLCSANPSNSVANKIAFSSHTKQLKRFDSSFTCGDAKFCYFSTHHLIGVGNNVNWSWVIDHPNCIVSYAPKKLTALVVSMTLYVTYRETFIWAPHGHSASFSTLLFYCGAGVLLGLAETLGIA